MPKTNVINVINEKKDKIKERVLFFAALAFMFLLFNVITKGSFLTISNIKTLISHSVIPSFIAWGMTFIFTTGTMDLSIGAIIILAANIAGMLGVQFGYAGLIVGGVVTAVILEFTNLMCFTKTKIPSWIAGIGMAMVYEAIVAIYSKERINLGLQTVDLGDNCRLLGIAPYNVIIWVIGLILAYLLYNKSSSGLNIRAVGSNISVSEMMGVNTKRTLLIGAIIGGIFIGLASVVTESSAGRIMPSTGLASISVIFTPLAVYLLAQAFENFINLSFGIMLGAFFISSLFNVLTILGVPSGTWQEIVLGMNVILFGVLSQRKNKGVVK